MALSWRWLHRSEWSRLSTTQQLGKVWRQLPDGARVAVVENAAGQIVGCWSFFPRLIAEGLENTAESLADKREVFRCLEEALNEATVAVGADRILTTADTNLVRAMILREGGQRIDLEFYALPVPLMGRWSDVSRKG